MQNIIKENNLITADGVEIAITHIIGRKDSVLVIANGWTMSKDSHFIAAMAREFSKTLDVISFDFRGHGSSSGMYTFTHKEPEDLKTVIDYAKSSYEKIYLLGFSLGGAVSIIYCSENTCIKSLVTVSAPHSFSQIDSVGWIKDFIKNPFKKYEFRRWIKIRLSPILRQLIKPIDVVHKISIPTLFISGELDSITSPEDTKSLFDKAECKKGFILFKNCNHAEDLLYQDGKRLINECQRWFIDDC